ncbi:MAG: alpha/beta hydrolase family protein [Candidatus Angelobacter sp.]
MRKTREVALSKADVKFTRAIIVCLLLTLGVQIALAQNPPASQNSKRIRVEDSVFRSASLGRTMHYLILIPPDYSNGRRLPVLYLLHGLYGDYKNWDTKTRLERIAAAYPFLIVTPDANDSWYTNSATNPSDKFEDYIAKDLISEIDRKYRTIPQKDGRAVAGLSMGGYGAVKLALKYPQLFAFAGSLSGAFNAAQNLDDLRPAFRAKLLEVFGNAGSATRRDNDVFLLLKNSQDDPHFYLACGTSDFFLETNRALAAHLSKQKIRYKYHETPGDHTWDYWDSELTPLLQAVERTFESTQKSN